MGTENIKVKVPCSLNDNDSLEIRKMDNEIFVVKVAYELEDSRFIRLDKKSAIKIRDFLNKNLD